jgi:NAD(P)-dependent dehydrogenase (short-subunit alcohol dehydrogenase family)
MKDVSNDVEILINQVDMLEEAQIEHMVQAAVDKWGRVDYAVNSAGTPSLLLLSLHFLFSLMGDSKRCLDVLVNGFGGQELVATATAQPQ